MVNIISKENFAISCAKLIEEARKIAHIRMQFRNNRNITTNFIGSEGTELCFHGVNNEGYWEDSTSVYLIDIITDEMLQDLIDK